MLKLSQRDIKQGYVGVKHLAKKAVKEGKYELACSYIRHCATLAQQFNWIYSDDELEELLSTIAHNTLPPVPSEYDVDSNRVVLYDDFCVSFVLALQYLDALVAAGREILYITPAVERKKRGFADILDVVSSKPNVSVYQVTAQTEVKRNQEIYQAIIDFHPAQILLHCYAMTPMALVLHVLPNQITSYIINLADQTFWLGARVVNYVLEFRQFGASVSQQRRNINPQQQLLVPFYPIADNVPFQGFPEECSISGKITIFSGGDVYKVLDKRMMYWHLVKRILNTYPEVVFLYATKVGKVQTEFLDKFIKENHFEHRFIYVNYRKDIDAVLAHADIYMGTCPVSGSLMSQLAARNATPILQYYYPDTPDDETEQALCINDSFQISFQDEDAFMEEAEKLIHDVTYRRKQGERLQKAMISIPQFNDVVAKTLSTNSTQFPLHSYQVNYEVLDDRWFELERIGHTHTLPYLYGLIGKWICLKYAPMLWLKKQINVVLNFLSK